MCYWNREQYQNSLEDFTKAIELSPNTSEHYQNRAQLGYLHLELNKQALNDIDKAIELSKGKFALQYQIRGLINCELSEYKKAEDDFTKAIDLEHIDAKYKDAAEAFHQRGLLRYNRLRKKDEGKDDLLQAHLRKPKLYQATISEVEEETDQPKKRGRPPKSAQNQSKPKRIRLPDSDLNQSTVDQESASSSSHSEPESETDNNNNNNNDIASESDLSSDMEVSLVRKNERKEKAKNETKNNNHKDSKSSPKPSAQFQFANPSKKPKTKKTKVKINTISETNKKTKWPTSVSYLTKNIHQLPCNSTSAEEIVYEDFVCTEIKDSPQAGLGLFATMNIPEGTCLEYFGQFVPRKNDSTATALKHGRRKFIWGVDYSWDLDSETSGNETRFINSYRGIADSPNMIMEQILFQDGPHVLFKATRNIRKGEELLTCYGDDYFWTEQNCNTADEAQIMEDLSEHLKFVGKPLGQGSFAVIRVAKYFKEEQVAVKHFHELRNAKGLCLQEWKILQQARHPKIVQAYACGTHKESPDSEPRFVIVMEYSTLGDLGQYVQRTTMSGPRYEHIFVPSIMKHVAVGMAFLHAKQIVHRDLKLSNVLLFEDHQNNIYAKIADVGISKQLENNNTIGAGTPAFIAPEAENVSDYSPKVDVYSYGMLLLFVMVRGQNWNSFTGLCRKSPKDREKVIKEKIHSIKMDKFWRDIIVECLETEPKKRPAFEVIIERLRQQYGKE